MPSKPLDLIFIDATTLSMNEEVELDFGAIDIPVDIHDKVLEPAGVENRYNLQDLTNGNFCHRTPALSNAAS